MQSVSAVAVIVVFLAIALFVAPLGIWTEVSRARKVNEKLAKAQMEELKRIEAAVKLCANILNRMQ